MARLRLKARHRIICGDATDATTVETLLGGECDCEAA